MNIKKIIILFIILSISSGYTQQESDFIILSPERPIYMEEPVGAVDNLPNYLWVYQPFFDCEQLDSIIQVQQNNNINVLLQRSPGACIDPRPNEYFELTELPLLSAGDYTLNFYNIPEDFVFPSIPSNLEDYYSESMSVIVIEGAIVVPVSVDMLSTQSLVILFILFLIISHLILSFKKKNERVL